jgi:hypothetical protein
MKRILQGVTVRNFKTRLIGVDGSMNISRASRCFHDFVRLNVVESEDVTH